MTRLVFCEISLPRLGDVVDLIHSWYPPGTADSWDAVGLVAGDPDAEVRRVLLAVDPTLEVAARRWRGTPTCC